MPLNNERISYYRVDKLLWRWKLRDGTDGCKIVPDIALSMDMAPPPLPKQPAPKTVPTKPAPKPPKPHAFDKMVDDIERVSNAISRFKTWLNTPDPPKVPKPAPIEKKKETVPPFDLQEIPSAMRKLWMPISAKLMERWFAGALNYSPTDDDEAAYINQDGMPYPLEMYDTTTVKLDWVLKYERAKAQYDALQKNQILAYSKITKIDWGSPVLAQSSVWRNRRTRPLQWRFEGTAQAFPVPAHRSGKLTQSKNWYVHCSTSAQ
ncbi:DUF6402 family protein [Burkholderia ubonensis]|uniref:DUF6402 family protein n=1 Tax=Burkholderia ubonensis TaxID=101571 RepID=UPI000A8C167E|nr:DUF6402 family protein [Burkholderia ubonensis]